MLAEIAGRASRPSTPATVKADLVASLGTNCALTYNLRQFYGTKETGLFDWTITPLACLPALIRARFALVDDRFGEALARVELADGDSVVHAPTGVLLHHAFRRDRRGRLAAGWRSEIEAVAAKFRFLGERMDLRLDAARRPALFLNGTGFHAALGPDAVELTHAPDAYAKIVDALRETYPGGEPVFCLLDGHEASVERVRGRDDVRAVRVGNRGDWHNGTRGHYAGCKSAWRDALASLDVELCGQGGRRDRFRLIGR